MDVARLVVLGRVLSFENGTSPRGMAVINLRLEDSTGTCRVMLYYRTKYEELCQEGGYVKLGLTAKCGGLVYRPELKLTGDSMTPLQDFNELTEHYLECMRAELLVER